MRAKELHDARVYSESIVWSFYAAVHYATTYLVAVRRVTFISSHNQRDNLMHQDAVLGGSIVYDSYADLQELSEDARYGVTITTEADSRAGLVSLRAVADAVTKALP